MNTTISIEPDTLAVEKELLEKILRAADVVDAYDKHEEIK